MNVALHGLETFIVRELTRRTGKPITQALTLNTLMDLHLTADEIAILHGYTWGWVTHLQLAGLAGQGQSDKAGFFESLVSSFPPPPINDILDMILKNQSGDIRKFLLYTSLLDSLNVSLYEEVTRLSDCQAILMHLEQVNPFFLALNDERTWYRYHQHFAALLRTHLQTSQSEDFVRTLHRRTARWYQSHNYYNEAMRHLLQG